MADGFVGEIRSVAFNFAPKGWANCDGAILSVASNQALYSLLLNTYGGSYPTTFALPDLRGRIPVNRSDTTPLGLRAGSEGVTLTSTQLPKHTHALEASAATGTNSSPVGRFPAVPNGGQLIYAGGAPSGGEMAPTGAAGGNQSHNNVQPSLAINFVIALLGVYPSRN